MTELKYSGQGVPNAKPWRAPKGRQRAGHHISSGRVTEPGKIMGYGVMMTPGWS